MPYLGLIVLIVWVGCLVDVICAEESRVRHLPKTVWLVIVILLPLVGSVVWLVVGRPQGGRWSGSRPSSATGSRFPEYDRPGRQLGQQSESDEEFLRRCRERAAEQRRISKEQERRRREQGGDDPGRRVRSERIAAECTLVADGLDTGDVDERAPAMVGRLHCRGLPQVTEVHRKTCARPTLAAARSARALSSIFRWVCRRPGPRQRLDR
jgi:uncharacterized membrane protein